MITKRIEFRYAPKPVKLKKGQKPPKPYKKKPPFNFSTDNLSQTSDFEKALDKARKYNDKTKQDVYVKDANGVVVFSITTTVPNEKEEPSEPQSGRADRPDVSDRSGDRPRRSSTA